MRRWRIGVMEYWKIDEVECWSNAVIEWRVNEKE